MQQVVTITGFEEKKRGESQYGPWALRLFTTAGGTKFQTFDVDLGDSLIAGGLNTPVSVEYEIEETSKDGKTYKNNVIKGWGPPSETATASEPSQPTSSQDEFRRSKEEMRRTEAVKAAATIIASPNWQGDQSIETLGALAEAVSDLIANGAPVTY